MWVRSVSLKKNTERISKYEIHPETVHVAVSGYFSFGKYIYFSADITPSIR